MPQPLTPAGYVACLAALRDGQGAKAWQTRLGVVADGKPGPLTMAAAHRAGERAFGLTVDRTTLRLPPAQFMGGNWPKDLLVYHHTAGGSAASSLASWIATPTRVGTAYFVERDGKVFEVFDPAASCGHLGLGGRQETRSIGIELCNWGWLHKVGTGWRAWPRTKAGQPTVTVEDSKVHVAQWRGEPAWEVYPEAQIAASIRLGLYLIARFGLDPDVAPSPFHAGYDLDRFKAFRGVIAHAHVRKDKTDVSPAFPWERLRAAVEDAPTCTR